jgi:GT2 family glycosyltransferase
MPFRLVIVVGGAGESTTRYLRNFVAGAVDTVVVVRNYLLLQGQARNLVLEHCAERFCALLENDTIVHPRWLGPLFRCMQEERAAVVAPLILDRGRRAIHAAGGHLVEPNRDDSIEFHHRIDRQGQQFAGAGLRRSRVGYAENHCILIDREQLPDQALFDDVEPFDVDLGLALRRQGRTAYVEPASVVTYMDPPPVQVEDLEAFKFRWDYEAWAQRNRRFMQKWQVNYVQEPKRLSYGRQRLRLGLAWWWPTEFNAWMANQYMAALKWGHEKVKEGFRNGKAL